VKYPPAQRGRGPGPLHGTGGGPPLYAYCGTATPRMGGAECRNPDNNVLVRDAQDWLHELRGCRSKPWPAGTLCRPKSCGAEIAEVTACLDGVLESAQGA